MITPACFILLLIVKKVLTLIFYVSFSSFFNLDDLLVYLVGIKESKWLIIIMIHTEGDL